MNGKPVDNPPDQRTIVMKFGGTSVGTEPAMRQVMHILEQAQTTHPRLVVVVSALSGVTDILLESAFAAARGEPLVVKKAAHELLVRHLALADALVTDPALRRSAWWKVRRWIARFDDLCQAISACGSAEPEALDAVASLGERLSARLLSAALSSVGISSCAVDATRLIVTDSHFQAAVPDLPATTRRARHVLEPLLAQGCLPVATGFIAADAHGATTTLGRGGSDYTAAILGAALSADDVWIWTDVDGIMTADPRLVPEARTIPELTYTEAAELASFGAKVLHPKTVAPLVALGIGLRVCNTFNPSNPGTRLVTGQLSGEENAIRGVAVLHGLRWRPAYAAPLPVEALAVLPSLPPSAPASFPLDRSDWFTPDASSPPLFLPQDAAFEEEVALVTAVGAGVRRAAGRIFAALETRGIAVLAIASTTIGQNPSPASLSLVVRAGEAQAAARLIHFLIG
ncbi:MAG: aspartate kinase [Chloroflexi bacterium]|nr:aspartate kinase [Chloroflexota bacterium]